MKSKPNGARPGDTQSLISAFEVAAVSAKSPEELDSRWKDWRRKVRKRDQCSKTCCARGTKVFTLCARCSWKRVALGMELMLMSLSER